MYSAEYAAAPAARARCFGPERGDVAHEATNGDRTTFGERDEDMLTDFKEPVWAHIELFGHKSYFGRIQEATRLGAVGAAIEPITAAGFVAAIWRNGAAIYGVTPMAEEDVRRAVMPRAWRACETFKASVALPDLCLTCGRNEPEHQEERERIAALPPPAPIVDAEVDEDDGIPFDDGDEDASDFCSDGEGPPPHGNEPADPPSAKAPLSGAPGH